jgi:SAM-dependent methyltransferase
LSDVGRTFGRVADAYQRTRPEYAPAALDRVCSELGLESSATVLDLAAGTGKLTRALAARFARVIAVEPDDGMRGFVAGEALRGSAEAIPLADGTVDAVFVGDAFHWFDVGPALAEIRRVTRPGGGLAVLANDWWGSERPAMRPEARALLDELFQRFHSEGSAHMTAWIDVLEAELGPLGCARFSRDVPYEGRALAELLLTSSSPAALSTAERDELAARFVPLFEGGYVLGVTTEVFWARLP